MSFLHFIGLFLPFFFHKRKSLYFCPAIPGEIGTARESAFFALFLTSEPRHFTNITIVKRRIEDGAFTVLFVYSCTYINSGADHYSIFLF